MQKCKYLRPGLENFGWCTQKKHRNNTKEMQNDECRMQKCSYGEKHRKNGLQICKPFSEFFILNSSFFSIPLLPDIFPAEQARRRSRCPGYILPAAEPMLRIVPQRSPPVPEAPRNRQGNRENGSGTRAVNGIFSPTGGTESRKT